MTGPIGVKLREVRPLQAWRVTADNVEEVAEWAGGGCWPKSMGEPLVWLRSDKNDPVTMADVKVEPGEYVVQGVTGHFFRATAEEFSKAYEEIKA